MLLVTRLVHHAQDYLVDYLFNGRFIVGKYDSARNRQYLSYVALLQAGVEDLLQDWVLCVFGVLGEVVQAAGFLVPITMLLAIVGTSIT